MPSKKRTTPKNARPTYQDRQQRRQKIMFSILAGVIIFVWIVTLVVTL